MIIKAAQPSPNWCRTWCL